MCACDWKRAAESERELPHSRADEGHVCDALLCNRPFIALCCHTSSLLTASRRNTAARLLPGMAPVLAQSSLSTDAPFPINWTQGITPLVFVQPDRVDGARRRLALRDGWRVEGNLHTLGYFAGSRHCRTHKLVPPLLHLPDIMRGSL
jgi:hypothetical protein